MVGRAAALLHTCQTTATLRKLWIANTNVISWLLAGLALRLQGTPITNHHISRPIEQRRNYV